MPLFDLPCYAHPEGWKRVDAYWASIENGETVLKTPHDVTMAVRKTFGLMYGQENPFESEDEAFTCLQKALEHPVFAWKQHCDRQRWKHPIGLMPKMAKWARELPQAWPKSPNVLERAGDSIELTPWAVRSFMANLFWGTLDPAYSKTVNMCKLNTQHVLDIDSRTAQSFFMCYTGRADPMISPDYYAEGVERTAALLAYFVQMDMLDRYKNEVVVNFYDDRTIRYEMVGYGSGNEWWLADDTVIGDAVDNIESGCDIHNRTYVDNIVDFANRDVHIGSIIRSCTQEEVLFSAHAECFPAMFFTARMQDHRAMVIKGVMPTITYEGYSHTFHVTDIVCPISPLLRNVVVMDAVMEQHFSPAAVMRDLNKAFVGFSAIRWNNTDEVQRIYTGKWGCGIFGGDPVFKFVQQVLAAAASHTELCFSTYGDEELCKKLYHLYDDCICGKTIGEVARALVAASEQKYTDQRYDFETYFKLAF